ncbi:hypothetical protein ADK37_29980 [Streptomyces resistomycificus]|uniref:Uncharacterized protein n=1 Tax=Streptomyces resistomycificus TaxID=67356 RepID=A0A0L8L0N6_9ACTN|nr:hypothetical protein ADK37_29980 [Streptomyces resistomycificus]
MRLRRGGALPRVSGFRVRREPVLRLFQWLKDRWQERVRLHVSSERVSAGCEVFLVIAWLYEHRPWS